jgi:hypothetical protein
MAAAAASILCKATLPVDKPLDPDGLHSSSKRPRQKGCIPRERKSADLLQSIDLIRVEENQFGGLPCAQGRRGDAERSAGSGGEQPERVQRRSPSAGTDSLERKRKKSLEPRDPESRRAGAPGLPAAAVGGVVAGYGIGMAASHKAQQPFPAGGIAKRRIHDGLRALSRYFGFVKEEMMRGYVRGHEQAFFSGQRSDLQTPGAGQMGEVQTASMRAEQ